MLVSQSVNRLVRAKHDVVDGSGGRREVVLQTRRGSDRDTMCAGERPGERVGGTIVAGRGHEVDGLEIQIADSGEANGHTGYTRVLWHEGADALEVEVVPAFLAGLVQ